MSEAWLQAFTLVMDPYNIFVMLAAALFGLFVGAVPGLTATMATALLVPVTFFMAPIPAIAAIVTATASPDLAVLHPRVPVTIAPDYFERWLDGLNNDAESVMALLVGPQPGEFAWHEISTRVNAAANDDAQLILPITEEERAAEEPKPAKKAAPRKPA